jgi:hypothetical protein
MHLLLFLPPVGRFFPDAIATDRSKLEDALPSRHYEDVCAPAVGFSEWIVPRA